MLSNITIDNAIDLLENNTTITDTEIISIYDCYNRILAEDIIAKSNVPHFNKSAYDGYALKSRDIQNASTNNTVTLKITEEIPAGSTPTKEIVSGVCAKVLTGAPIPDGADCVVPYEICEFSHNQVTFYLPHKGKSNIVQIGEDVKKGDILAKSGTLIDTGTIGVISAQNITEVKVYKQLNVGIISTGNEVASVGDALSNGQIINSNEFTLSYAVKKIGTIAKYIGTAKDDINDIANLIEKGLKDKDILILSGGVSVGDYDLTPLAMEKCGIDILFKGVKLKPGMACAYGVKGKKLICALSGNPASSYINFLTIAMPIIKRIQGFKDYKNTIFDACAYNDYPKGSKVTRILLGNTVFSNGKVYFKTSSNQGNAIISSIVGTDTCRVMSPGKECIKSGDMIKCFKI